MTNLDKLVVVFWIVIGLFFLFTSGPMAVHYWHSMWVPELWPSAEHLKEGLKS